MTNQEHLQPERTPADPIEGSWSPLWSMGDGEPMPAEDLRDVKLTFADGRCEVHRAECLVRPGTYSVDRTRSPETIDVHFTDSDVPELIGAMLLGIYEVDAGRLRICYGPPGGHRARDFSAEQGTGQYVAEYCRS